MAGYTVGATELSLLRGLRHVSIALYLMVLRPAASPDGRVRSFSWASAARAISVDQVPGRAAIPVTATDVRRSAMELQRVGLVLVVGETITLPHATGRAEVAEISCAETYDKSTTTGGNLIEGDTRLSNRHVHRVSPPFPSPPSPPITPSPSSPQNPPIPSAAPAFELTPPASEEAIEPEVITQELRARGRIPTHWVPSPATMKALAQKGIAPELALREVGSFVLYWSAATGQAALKRAEGWQLAFLKWCVKLVPHQKTGPQNAAQRFSTGGADDEQNERTRQRGIGASGRQAERIEQYFRKP